MSRKQLSIVQYIPQHVGIYCFPKCLHFLINVLNKEIVSSACVWICFLTTAMPLQPLCKYMCGMNSVNLLLWPTATYTSIRCTELMCMCPYKSNATPTASSDRVHQWLRQHFAVAQQSKKGCQKAHWRGFLMSLFHSKYTHTWSDSNSNVGNTSNKVESLLWSCGAHRCVGLQKAWLHKDYETTLWTRIITPLVFAINYI